MDGKKNTGGCEELNRQFGSPGRIVFRPSRHGTPIVTLANRYGSAEVALLGAQTISYRPTGNAPVLYMPHPYDSVAAGTEIHGGIPVCWPWFAKEGPDGSKMHGIARYATWTVTGTEYDEDVTEITLGLQSSEETLKLWPHKFALRLKISLSMKLTLALTAKNTGDEEFLVTEGFHPYLLVSDRDKTELRGVDGFEFTDTNEPEKGKRTWSGGYEIRSGGSKIFDAAKYEYALLDSGLNRAIAVVSRGNRNLVVWNPGEVRGRDVAAFGLNGWKKFVCVEPASTPRENGHAMKPGETHKLMMAVQAVPNDGSVHGR